MAQFRVILKEASQIGVLNAVTKLNVVARDDIDAEEHAKRIHIDCKILGVVQLPSRHHQQSFGCR